MSVWSHVEGTISVHRDDHFSVEKALHDHFDDYGACVSVVQKRITNEIIKVEFDFCYCMENEGAYKVWKVFAEHVRDNISLRNNTCGMDATISIRWLI